VVKKVKLWVVVKKLVSAWLEWVVVKIAVFGFFLEEFCDISHRLGGITPFGVFSDAFPGLKMWVTFACATAIF
jgi:hypothetical protein